MANLIGSRKETTFGLVSADMDDGGWRELPEISDEFEPAMWIVMEQYDISMDPTMSHDQAMANRDLGVLSASFSVVDDSRKQWTVYINWQTKWAQKIPPHHMAVSYDGQAVGVLSPFLTMRTCWNCGLGNPVVDGEYADEGYYRGDSEIPWVLPAHGCPRCGQFDWFGIHTNIIGPHMVRREDFQRSAAEHWERLSGQEGMADKMSIIHKPDGMRHIRG